MDDDFIWLFENLKVLYPNFTVITNLKLNVPQTLLIKDNDIKAWVGINKRKLAGSTRKVDQIAFKGEQWLKHKHFYEYSKNNNVKLETIEKNEMMPIDIERHISVQNQKPEKLIGYFYQQKSNSIPGILQPLGNKAFKRLFESSVDFLDYFSKYQKFILHDQYDPQLFKTDYTFNNEQNKKSIEIKRLNVVKKMIQIQDIEASLTQNQKDKKLHQQKNDEQQIYKNYSSAINQICEQFTKQLIRFIEHRYQRVVNTFSVEFILQNKTFTIVSAYQIRFYDQAVQNVDYTDKSHLSVFSPKPFVPNECLGIYCNNIYENVFYDENDELFSLFIFQDDNNKQTYYTQKKSIILDIIERYKAFQLLQTYDIRPEFVTELLLFKVRKYYSISQLLTYQKLKHLSSDILYQRQKVCLYCYYMYDKIDNLRIKKLEKNIKYTKDEEEEYIKRCIEKYKTSGSQMRTNDNQKHYKIFQEKLKEFDLKPENLDKFQQSNYFQKTDQMSKMSFMLPKVLVKTGQTQKYKSLKKKNLYVKESEQERLGLKHFFGNTENLFYSDVGLAISTSSLKLNNLQSKLNILQKEKQREDQKKIKKICEEIEIVYCPYKGKGESEQQGLQQYIQQLKERDANDETSSQISNQLLGKVNQKIQVVTDKNKFLTMEQIHAKQEKEKNEELQLKNKRDFLENNTQLAQSIINKKMFEKSKENFYKQDDEQVLNQTDYSNSDDYY